MERYTRVFSLPTNLYGDGSLVIIEAGALLKDNANNTMLAQVKFKNIYPKAIKMLKAEIISKDSMGRVLEQTTTYQYLDLNVRRNDSFGSKQAIALPDSSVRSFDVNVVEVGLEDNSIVHCSVAKWNNLPKPKELENSELSKQCRIAYGEDFKYEAVEFSDLWYCACGALNRKTEETCHKCSRAFKLLSNSDIQELTTAMEQRLTEEKRQQELAEEKQKAEAAEAERIRKITEAEAAARKKRTNKIWAITGVSIAVAAAIILLVIKIVIPNQRYNAAVALMDAGQYDEAVSTFQKIPDYKDSSNLIQNCQALICEGKYTQAIQLAEQEHYTEAIELFETISPYKDSETLLQLAKQNRDAVPIYENALKEYTAGNYSQAYNLFGTIEYYKDAVDYLVESKYQYAVHLLTYGENVNYDSIEEAKNLFEEILQYKDSKEYLKHFLYREIECKAFEEGKERTATPYVTGVYDEYGRNIANGEQYDENGNDISNGKVYNADNRLIEHGGYNYQYDRNGKLVSETWNTFNGTNKGDAKYEYDINGLLTRKTSHTHYSWQSTGTYSNKTITTTYFYDSNKRLFKKMCVEDTNSSSRYGNGKITTYTFYEYDSNGNLYREFERSRDDYFSGSLVDGKFYEYDDNSNLIRTKLVRGSSIPDYFHEYMYRWIYAPKANME